MDLEKLQGALPDWAKDLRLNLSSLQRSEVLSEQQLWGAMLASAVFAFETTLQPMGLLPLLGGCAASYLVASLLMRNSIMTEKIARRGIRTPSEYLPDPLDQVLVRDVGARNVVTLRAGDTLGQVRRWLETEAVGTTHQGFPVLDDRGILVGVLTRRDLESFVPPQERFFSGGQNTVRGFNQNQLGPAVYVVTAFLASYAERPVGLALVVMSASIETLLYAIREQRTDPRDLTVHLAFILLFGVMSALFTRVEIARIRARSKKELEQERVKVRDESRLFRLSSPSSRSEGDDDRLFQSSVEEVHQSVFHVLKLLHRALDLHTCVALMLDDDHEKLRIVELVTDSDQIAEGPFSAGEGAVGAVAKRGQVMSLEMAKGGSGAALQ